MCISRITRDIVHMWTVRFNSRFLLKFKIFYLLFVECKLNNRRVTGINRLNWGKCDRKKIFAYFG